MLSRSRSHNGREGRVKVLRWEAPIYDGVERVVEDKGIRIGEAADMYGDLDTVEEYGYVSRG